MSEQFRSSLNFNEFFGTDSREVFDAEEQAEGYLAGSKYATWIQENVNELYGDRSKSYREGILTALREQL